MAPEPVTSVSMPSGSGAGFFLRPLAPGEDQEVKKQPVPRCVEPEDKTPGTPDAETYHDCLLRQQYFRTFNRKVELLTELPKEVPSLDEANWGWLHYSDSANNLEAARTYLEDIFYTSYRLADLQLANQYLEANLPNVCPEYYPEGISYGEIMSECNFAPADCYKTQLFRLRVLAITDPGAAVTLAMQMETDLADKFARGRQDVNDISAEGYQNQVNLFKLYAAYYNLGGSVKGTPSLEEAIALADRSAAWSQEQSERLYIGLRWDNMDRRDCVYDALNARLIKGMLQAKAGQIDAALVTFGELLKEPAALRKYGGYLDIALQAFFNILYISLRTAETLPEAAARFDQAIASSMTWAAFQDDEHKDLREALGMLIRKGERWSDETLNWFGKRGQNLGWGWGWLIPVDESATINEINLADYQTPEAKLELFIDRLLPFIQIRDDFKNAIRREYRPLVKQNGGNE